MRPRCSREGHSILTNRDGGIRFLERFSAGDLDGLGSLLAQDLRLEGPIHRWSTGHEYLSRLRADPPIRSGNDIISITEATIRGYLLPVPEARCR